MNPKYEIGSVYRYNCELFLALSDRLLLTFKKGKPIRRKPTTQYQRVKAISVDQLCHKWNISAETLDKHTSEALAPHTARTAPRGSAKRNEDVDYYELRRVRVLS